MSDANVIHADAYDERAYQAALDDVPELADVERAGNARSSLFPWLCRDVFHSLFKLQPRLRDPAPIEKHGELLEALMVTTEWAHLRQATRLDHIASGVGTAELARGLIDKLPEDADEQRRALRGLARSASERVDYLVDLSEAWGVQPGTAGRADLQGALTLATHVRRSPRLQRIAELAGRMRRIALHKHRTRARHLPDEVCDIELGRDLARVLPHELATLRHPSLRVDFLRRYAEGQLLQYRLEGTERLGRGPIIVCLDSSGSMDGPKDAWAKAVTLGLLAIAHEERREFAIIHFGSATELRAWRFTTRPDPVTVAACLDWFFGGGTDFSAPLEEALGIALEAPFDRADVVFITDGLCTLSDEFVDQFNRRREARGIRVYSVLIDAGSASDCTLGRFSDAFEVLSDLARDADALDLTFSL